MAKKPKKRPKNKQKQAEEVPLRQRLRFLPLLLILFLALSLRLYKVTSQPLDWHSFRQADTASVTREYVKQGVNLLEPKYHDVSNIQSGQDNPQGYRMVEFPIINAGIAVLLRTFTFLDLATTSRLLAVFASLLTLLSIYEIARLISGRVVGLAAALVFAVLPYAVYYSRVILPEPFMLAALSGAIACFALWLKRGQWYYYPLSLLLFALAVLLKPFVLFLAPVFLALFMLARVQAIKPSWFFFGLFWVSILPFGAWRWWITHYPDGIPASTWLFNGNGIRLRPAWFRWLGYERLTKLLLGWVGVVLAGFSLYKLTREEVLVYGSWWLGILAYLIVIATGNVQHDYYQNLLLPILAITVGRGLVMLVTLLQKKMHPVPAWAIGLGVLLLAVAGSWSQVKGYYQLNHTEYLRAGQAVDALVPADALVIAPAFGDTQFLFQTNRRGWPIGFEIADKIEKGAQIYVTTALDDEAKELQAKYFTLEQTSEYLILDLTKPAAP